ncbi:uncharacterized protein LOC114361411 [Ostrinia furnacalis]|uniref:uncharacterized protein LOC114361411 n=1 Tax=Ostrinia furnacalis TaxID=93504 RepID=UPI001039A5A1|nr:uncharacterized protein LOC114361411 [Ostrinia furnacalis]
MTNKEDGDSNCDPRIAGLLAVHLVSQVLDEAYVIANAATESGQPWRYLAMLKNLRSGPLIEEIEGDDTLTASKRDEEAVQNNTDSAPNVVATSTPQKEADEIYQVLNETSFIGQGDEENDLRQNELTKSTSMFINHLFDMSEVERVIICDDNDTENIRCDSNDLLTEAMTKIMESYVNTALGIAFGEDLTTIEPTGQKSPSTEHSGYSFLSDAFTADFGKDMAFCEDNEPTNKDYGCTSVVTEITEEVEQQGNEKSMKNDDVAFYENTYLTLNRDYDQCSDDDGDPILQDTKCMSMQEVELMAMPTSDENSPRIEEPVQHKSIEELAATSAAAVSASASGSRKSGLVQRCRTQGARLLACLRGWWRRKTPGKRREVRVPGSVRGLCPLSPDARRRAASLLDQRKLCSSPPSAQHVVWKFNTVSEALVNSSRWKNYTFDVNPDECGEY